MLIAKLRVELKNVDIHFNSHTELGTDKIRGAILPDGAVVRGLGTHFKDKDAKERYDTLIKEANSIRNQFNRQFVRTPIEGTFIIPVKGQAKLFIDGLTAHPDIDVSVIEFELASANGGLDPDELAEWGQRVKNQIVAIPLGRGEDVDESGVAAIATLAECPAMARITSNTIKELVQQVRNGSIARKDLKQALEKLAIEMDPAAL